MKSIVDSNIVIMRILSVLFLLYGINIVFVSGQLIQNTGQGHRLTQNEHDAIAQDYGISTENKPLRREHVKGIGRGHRNIKNTGRRTKQSFEQINTRRIGSPYGSLSSIYGNKSEGVYIPVPINDGHYLDQYVYQGTIYSNGTRKIKTPKSNLHMSKRRLQNSPQTEGQKFRIGHQVSKVGLIGDHSEIIQANIRMSRGHREHAGQPGRYEKGRVPGRRGVDRDSSRSIRPRRRFHVSSNWSNRVNSSPMRIGRRQQRADMNSLNRNTDVQPGQHSRDRVQALNSETDLGSQHETIRRRTDRHLCSYGIPLRDYWCGGRMHRQCPPGFVCMSNPFVIDSVGYCCGNVFPDFDNL